MKKSYLMIAATALLLAACSDIESFRKDVNSEETSNNAINFSTFTSKQTRAENSDALYTWAFINNHTSFQVWGFKDNAAAPDKPVFNGTTVTVSGDVSNTSYTYSPKRFWDKASNKYHFYAAAPAGPTGENPAWKWEFDGTGINSADNLGKGCLKTTSTIKGVNLKNIGTGDGEGPSTTLSNFFKGKADIDLMIAAPCDFARSRYAKPNPDAVQLNFNHILSKLNVTVRKGDNLIDDNNSFTVVVKSFEVVNMHKAGLFTETAIDNLADGTTARWTLTGTDKVTYEALTSSASTGLVLGNNKKPIYIVESLVIPQDIAFKRVALDGQHHDEVEAHDPVYYSSYAEYCAAKPVEALSKDEFDAILADLTNANPDDLAEITKVPAITAEDEIDAVTADNNHPYFVITYTINDEEYTAYYNLAAAFGSGTTEDDPQTTDIDETSTIAFNEGWQNTLNIVINPDAIEFTADVADWATVENTVYITEEEETQQQSQNP